MAMFNASNQKQTNSRRERFPLMWLDSATNNSNEQVKAEQQLRSIIDHFITFTDISSCRKYISTNYHDAIMTRNSVTYPTK